MITEDYVSFETAKLLKEKGFYSPYCYYYYFPDIESKTPCVTDRVIDVNEDKYLAPTHQMAMKWLREVHRLHITIFSSSQESWMYRITKPHQTLEEGYYGEDYISFEQACEAAIKYCLKNLI